MMAENVRVRPVFRSRSLINPHRQAQGFTLIELLIAMSLTAMIGVLAAQFLGAAIDAEARSTSLLEEVNDVEQVWQLLASDLEQIAMSPLSESVAWQQSSAREGQSAALPSLVGGTGWRLALEQATALTGGILLFKRHGWDNPLQQNRSDVQRVMYRLEGGTLIREYWRESHQPMTSPPSGRLRLLVSVNDIRVEFLPSVERGTGGSGWVSNWPTEALRSELDDAGQGSEQESEMDENTVPPVLLSRPLAVAVTVETEAMGRIQRFFSLPGL